MFYCIARELKLDSGTGWPSFRAPVKNNVVNYVLDTSYNMKRIEATCSFCDAHLGHVFPHGSDSNGLRYCINALALEKLV
ncbi:MAG: peptide-methionine (R)-S-oxide reductase [Lishizhenia sp.]